MDKISIHSIQWPNAWAKGRATASRPCTIDYAMYEGHDYCSIFSRSYSGLGVRVLYAVNGDLCCTSSALCKLNISATYWPLLSLLFFFFYGSLEVAVIMRDRARYLEGKDDTAIFQNFLASDEISIFLNIEYKTFLLCASFAKQLRMGPPHHLMPLTDFFNDIFDFLARYEKFHFVQF